jgi:hypothetical protein
LTSLGVIYNPHKNTNVKKRPSPYPKMSAYKNGEIRKSRPSLHSQFFLSAENAESQSLQPSLNFNLAMFFLLKLINTYYYHGNKRKTLPS